MELRCPVCGEAMKEEEFGFWKCPVCGGEWWPDEEKTEEKQILECFQDTLIIPHKRKSSGGGRRRKKVKKSWVPLPSERYMLI